MFKTIRSWTIGDYVFAEVEMHHSGQILYGFEFDGSSKSELYETLDMAMISAVGEKHTGPRGATGTNVGTAADWFAKMIGMPTP